MSCEGQRQGHILVSGTNGRIFKVWTRGHAVKQDKQVLSGDCTFKLQSLCQRPASLAEIRQRVSVDAVCEACDLQCDSTSVSLAALCKMRSHRIDEELSMQLQTVLVQRASFLKASIYCSQPRLTSKNVFKHCMPSQH